MQTDTDGTLHTGTSTDTMIGITEDGTVHGSTAASTIHGSTGDIMILGTMEDGMIHGTQADFMIRGTSATEDGMTHGTDICTHTTAVGTEAGIHTGTTIIMPSILHQGMYKEEKYTEDPV